MRQLAGLSWLVRYRLWKASAPVALVPPSKVKLYATGKGQGADKLAMVRAAERFPGVEIEDDNAADALWLAAMGARHLGMPVDDVPQAHAAALMGVTWPFLAGEVAA
jgi:crossover junction endodeoxyribonuclease RuvC